MVFGLWFGFGIAKAAKDSAKTSYDILRALNATLWGGLEGAEKTATIVKSGLSSADIIIGTSHALEDFGCQDYICGSFDVIGSVSSAVGLVIGNLPATKRFTTITGSVTVCCRTVRYYCKNYGTFWGCTVAVGEGLKNAAKFTINR